MDWTVEKVPELKGYTVEWAEPENFFLSRGNTLYHSRTLKPPFARIGIIDAPLWKRAAGISRLAQRLLRFQMTNVIPLSDNEIFVTFDKSVGIIRDGVYRDLTGLSRPCRVLRAACARDERGDIYFGEYLANDARGEMRIYRYGVGGKSVETAYVFPANSIKHIHGIYFDEISKALYCLTGDDDRECRILCSTDGFKTMETIGEGDETWRAVSILFDRSSFFYGMDAEYRTNHIYQVDRRTLERKSLGEVSGTVFYSKRLGDNLFFTTTAENAPSQIENVAALWLVNEDEKLQKLASFAKDRWHPTLFQFGTIHFPYQNKLEHELYFHLVGVKEDNLTFRARAKAR